MQNIPELARGIKIASDRAQAMHLMCNRIFYRVIGRSKGCIISYVWGSARWLTVSAVHLPQPCLTIGFKVNIIVTCRNRHV